MTTTERKQQVTELLKSLETGAPEPLKVIDPEQYIQHNLSAPDGIEGFRALQGMLAGKGRVNTIRVLEDGDYVIAHSEVDIFGPKVAIDVFRFENGLIVEHWDNLQPIPEGLNPSGRSLIDGPVELEDLDRTEANKAAAAAFVEDILMHGRYDKAGEHIDGENYVQHHSLIADGKTSLINTFKALAEQGTPVRYTAIHQVLGEGNFVLVVSESEAAGESTAFYDLFRIANGKVAEHWDVVEPIPPRDEWQNQNGKF